MKRTTNGSFPEENSSAGGSMSATRAVFLVGFMGAGKTSVGKVLGSKLGWAFQDLDDLIQSRVGRRIEAIFRESGEPEFRRAEHDVLRQLLSELDSNPRVVALGGGAFVQPENAKLLQEAGFPSVFLDAPVNELFNRCQIQTVERPLRRDPEQFRNLYASRRAAYLQAVMRVDTSNKEIEEIATEIVTNLELRPSTGGTGVTK
jgi:shikimate kinase